MLTKLANINSYYRANLCDCPHSVLTRFDWAQRKQGLRLRILIWTLCFSTLLSLSSNTYAQNPTEAERSKEIEKLKSEIQKIKEEQQKQIEELQKRIEELEAETKREKEKEYVEPSKPPKEVEEAPAQTYVMSGGKILKLVTVTDFLSERRMIYSPLSLTSVPNSSSLLKMREVILKQVLI